MNDLPPLPEITLGHYLTLAAILFTIGIFGIFLNRKNVIIILMSVELILLSVNINLVAFGAQHAGASGQVFALFVIAVVWPLQRALKAHLPSLVAVLITLVISLAVVGAVADKAQVLELVDPILADETTTNLAVSPDGKSIATASESLTVALRDLASGRTPKRTVTRRCSFIVAGSKKRSCGDPSLRTRLSPTIVTPHPSPS